MEKIALVLHGITLLFTLGVVAHSYLMGFNWMRGKVNTLDEKKVTRYHYYAWVGIVLMIITGASAFSAHAAEFLTKWQFHAKMGVLVILITNCFVINHLIKNAWQSSFKNLPKNKKIPIIISATIATLCWTAILVLAMFIGIDEK